MKCPHCENDVELTWLRYWKAPMGRHICPHCSEHFQMKHSFRYYGTIFVLWIIFGLIPAYVAFDLGASELLALAIYVICGAIFIFPLDRRIDATWRGTVLQKRKNA